MVQRATEPATQVGISKPHGHHAIVDLSGGTAVLTLYARGFVSAFWETRFVDQPDRIVAMVRFRNQFLQSIKGTLVIPGVCGEKILQRPRRHAKGIGHRLQALPLNAGELAAHVPPQMLATFATCETITEQTQESIQITGQSANASNIHVYALQPIIAGGFIV
jgi:hypothetical protein